ncbi:hypothetical protein D6774_02685 [Candidatus Woesearchaeota archaeon]|nr:MAG: hypothetical protein D6774_02685 [Candidatus Woesearchaeota archaeon]
MKRDCFILISIISLSLLLGLVQAQTITGFGDNAELTKLPLLRITLVNQEPEPVAPGSFVELKLLVENIGGDTADNVELKVIPAYPFSAYEEQDIIPLGKLQGRQMDDDGKIIRYRLRVAENAIDGLHHIRFAYRLTSDYGKTNWVETDDYPILVRAEQPFLSISEVGNTQLKPGKTTPITFRLKNDASSDFKNIEVTLDIGSSPFRPIGTSNNQHLDRISAKSSKDITFNLTTLFDAVSGTTILPINLTFSDDAGNTYTRRELIGLNIFDEPSYLTALEETTVYSSREPGSVILSLSNIGQSELKFVTATLLESEDYEIIGSRTAYLGNVESDDFETGEFTIYPYAKKEVNLTFRINYKDVYNNEYSDIVHQKLKLYSSSELKEFGIKKSGSSLGKVILLLILLAVIYFGYRRWEKKRK